MTSDPGRTLAPVVRVAPAKVNLTLAVLGTRPDGFHDLHSVFVPLDLADRLSVAVLPPGAVDTLHVDGFDPGPAADNLVLRAIRAAREAAHPAWGRPEPPPPLAARLEKRIPVAAGLAGGSSDAAAALDAALEAWGVDLDAATRHRVAASLGSDVPFFAIGGPALIEGRGERLTALGWLRDADSSHDRPGLLLVTPSCGVSTPAAYRAWDEGARSPRRRRPTCVGPPRRRAAPWRPRRGRPARPCVGAGLRQRPRPGRRRRGAGPRAVQAGAAPAARAPRGPIGLRPDPRRTLSFAC